MMDDQDAADVRVLMDHIIGNPPHPEKVVHDAFMRLMGSLPALPQPDCPFCDFVGNELGLAYHMLEEHTLRCPSCGSYNQASRGALCDDIWHVTVPARLTCDFEHPHPDHPCGRRSTEYGGRSTVITESGRAPSEETT